jgi:hypothetical protein
MVRAIVPSSLKAGMTTERFGETRTGFWESADSEGLGAKPDEYSAWYNFVFPRGLKELVKEGTP